MRFNLYIEEAMKKLKTEIQKGVQIRGGSVTRQRFAFCTEKEGFLQNKNDGIQSNEMKTKVMVFSKTDCNLVAININTDS